MHENLMTEMRPHKNFISIWLFKKKLCQFRQLLFTRSVNIGKYKCMNSFFFNKPGSLPWQNFFVYGTMLIKRIYYIYSYIYYIHITVYICTCLKYKDGFPPPPPPHPLHTRTGSVEADSSDVIHETKFFICRSMLISGAITSMKSWRKTLQTIKIK